uniref:RRM domain-containing protein n=1 Tax=Elaeophora elaphi TaxID=1147741 RepID=A0A0R3RJB2_9BILA
MQSLLRGSNDLYTTTLSGTTSGGNLLTSSLRGVALDSEAKKAKLDCSVKLATTGGMVLPSMQQQFLSAVAFANGAQFLQNSALLTQAFTVADNTPVSMAATTSAGDNGGQQISRVVHLRNIPSDMTDLELVHFCMPYGKLVNYLLLKGRNQAFVEYEDERSAQTLVTVNIACPVAIRDRTIFCQFSTHQELKTNRRPRAGSNGSNLIADQDDNEACLFYVHKIL